MKPKSPLPSLFILLALLFIAGRGHAQTAFTYQGQLREGATNANGTYSLRFMLYNAASGGTQIGSTLPALNLAIENGLFTVALDFGSAAFDGNARWLEITVQTLTTTNTLAPRVEVLRTPYAIFATKAGSVVNGAIQNPSFVGTTVNSPLEFFVNSTRALRLEPNTNSPNIIGGFSGNNVSAGVRGATIAGGGAAGMNVNQVSAAYGTIGGGWKNSVSAESGTIGGGQANSCKSPFATIGGGQGNEANGGNFATVSGGGYNSVTGDAGYIGGGYGNFARGMRSAVVGGAGNDNGGADGFIGGGYGNIARGMRSVTGGGISCVNNGQDAFLGAGNQNTISSNSPYGVLSGGYQNTVSGNTATVAGGQQNTASGALSFAAGQRAKANHQGSFVWADSTAADFTSTAIDQFSARARGGARFVSATDGSGRPTTGVQLAPGGGAWSSLSDRAAKANFRHVDGRDILYRLAEIPILSWNYKSQAESIRHIGPIAQDFSAAFQVGEDDKHINTIDADGVALAAIQGLHSIVKEKDTEIADLKKRLETLEEIVLKQNRAER